MNLVTMTDLFKNVVEVSHGLLAVIRYESTECMIREIVIKWLEVWHMCHIRFMEFHSFTSTCCVMRSLKCHLYGELFKITVCTIQLASVLGVARV